MGDFKDKTGKTRVGSFLQKFGKIVPEVLEFAGDITGIQALEKAGQIISGKKDLSPEQRELLTAQIEAAKEVEIARLADIDSARNREIEILKAGGKDHMMTFVGIVVMLLVIVCVFTVLFCELHNENLSHLVLGEVLGFGSGMVFYFYGSSKNATKEKST